MLSTFGIPFVIVAWLILSFAVSGGARNRGRIGWLWFIWAIIFTPVVIGFALIIIGVDPNWDERQRMKAHKEVAQEATEKQDQIIARAQRRAERQIAGKKWWQFW